MQHITPAIISSRNGVLSQDSNNQLSLIQLNFNNLDAQGVLKRPENVGIYVEFPNIFFLVFFLVKAFSDASRCSIHTPPPRHRLLLRQITQWKYIAVTDFTKTFFQILISRESKTYCRVATSPLSFWWIHVYRRGIITKLADDLTCFFLLQPF